MSGTVYRIDPEYAIPAVAPDTPELGHVIPRVVSVQQTVSKRKKLNLIQNGHRKTRVQLQRVKSREEATL